VSAVMPRRRFAKLFAARVARHTCLPPGRDQPVLFGHTHQPVSRGADELLDDIDGHLVDSAIPSGWLLKDVAAEFEHRPSHR
jgi:hypothetical protein